MRILFAGRFEHPATSGWQRKRGLEDLGHSIIPFQWEGTSENRLWHALKVRLLSHERYEKTLEAHSRGCCDRLLKAALHHKPDLLWLEWPLLVTGETIREIKQNLPDAQIVSFQNDNPFGSFKRAAYGWLRLIEAIPFYDCNFVKRESDLVDYKAKGAVRTELFREGYSEALCYPDLDGASDQYPVVFTGTALDHRISILDRLTGAYNIDVHIFGRRWNRTPLYPWRSRLLHPPIPFPEYRRVLSAARIVLGFVSHSNHDEFTRRTFEVPACGTFLLAERTPAHLSYFEEGKEAEFFSSVEECRDKINYYLKHDTERKRIADMGHRRCTESGYGIKPDLQRALQQVFGLSQVRPVLP